MNIGVLVDIVAGGIFLVFWITSFVILYHLMRFGIGTLPKKAAMVFLVGGATLFSLAILIYSELNI